jgi:hypothetical protein
MMFYTLTGTACELAPDLELTQVGRFQPSATYFQPGTSHRNARVARRVVGVNQGVNRSDHDRQRRSK